MNAMFTYRDGKPYPPAFRQRVLELQPYSKVAHFFKVLRRRERQSPRYRSVV